MSQGKKDLIIISSVILVFCVFAFFTASRFLVHESSVDNSMYNTINDQDRIVNEDTAVEEEKNETVEEEVSLGDCSAGCSNCLEGCAHYSAGVCVAKTYTCSSCSGGYKLSGGSCTKCSAGTYASAGSSSCSSCSAGHYSSAGASSCSTCSAGYYSGSGASSCTKCSAGYYSSAGSSSCTKCPKGKYSSSDGSSSCTKCPAGKYSSSEASTSCSSCSAGYSSPEGSTSSSACTKCAAGTYSTAGSACTACAAGTYASGKGSTSCTACAAGLYASGTGSTICTVCPDGQISSTTGATSCTACGEGKTSDESHTRCVDICVAGEHPTNEGTCEKCKAGYYCPDGKIMRSCAQEKNAYSEAGASSCTSCGIDKAKDDHTGCDKCTASIGSVTRKISPGEPAAIAINNKNCFGSFSITATNANPSSTSIAASSTGAVVSGTVRGKNKCTDLKWSGSIGSQSIGSATTKVIDDWHEVCSNCCVGEDLPDRIPANHQGDNTYGSGKRQYKDADGFYYCYTQIQTRECSSPPVIPKYTYCCVDNEVPGLSKSVFPVENARKQDCDYYAKEKGKPKANYTLLLGGDDGDFDMSKCVAPPEVPGRCDKSDIDVTDTTGAAEKCEDTVELTVSDGIKCTNNDGEEKSFYKIECKKEISTNFDYGDDGKTDTQRVLYKGQGFKFGIYVDTAVYCEYRFYDTVWKEVYNKFIEKINLIDENLANYVKNNDPSGWEKYITDHIKNIIVKKEDNVKYLYELWNIIEDLKEIVEDYNNYKTSDAYDENGDIKLTVKEDGEDVDIKELFDRETITEGSMKKSNATKKTLGIKDLTDPEDYDYSNAHDPRKIKLLPQKVCVSKHDGTVSLIEATADCDDKNLAGGRKVYIGKKTEEGTYDIKIKISGLGTNNAEVTNNKCNIGVLPYEIRYRSIDVGNAFINKDWNKGKNWVNEKYDFTKTIRENIWTASDTRNVIEIPGDDIKAIQSSNANYRNPKKDSTTGEMKLNSPYLGLCDAESYSDHDDITKKICDAIK